MCTKLDNREGRNLIRYSRNFFFLFIVVAGNFIIKRFGIFDKLSSFRFRLKLDQKKVLAATWQQT